MDNDPIREFAKWVIRTSCMEGYDLDGSDVQEKAQELGLIEEELYDPVKHPNVEDVEEGDGVFVFTALLRD